MSNKRARKNRLNRKPRVETLETRKLFSADFNLAGGTLDIDIGPDGADVDIGYYGTGSYLLVTSQNARTGATDYRFFRTSDVSSIDVNGSPRNDDVHNATSIPSILRGGDGDDRLVGGTAADQIFGDAGNDFLDGYVGDDVIRGGDGRDQLIGGYGNDAIYGEGGNDHLYGGSDNDTMYGGEGSDYLNGYLGDDQIHGEGGDDRIVALGGNDLITGGDGNDLIDAGDGHDRIYAGRGDDEVRGGNGNDIILGDDGRDQLFGDAGYDWLLGGNGDDYLDDGSGSESVNGGSGQNFNAYQWAINGAERDDVYQLQLPNCGNLSAMAAVSDQVDLASRIRYIGNRQYRVELYDAQGNATHQVVYFDGDYGMDAQPNPNQQASGGFQEFWTILYQRALTQQGQANEGLSVNEAWHRYDPLIMLTGKHVDRYEGVLNTSTHLLNLWQALSDGQSVIAMTTTNPSGGTVIGDHWYTVTGIFYDYSRGEWSLQMRNPWGVDGGQGMGDPNDGYVSVAWSDFNRLFERYEVART